MDGWRDKPRSKLKLENNIEAKTHNAERDGWRVKSRSKLKLENHTWNREKKKSDAENGEHDR